MTKVRSLKNGCMTLVGILFILSLFLPGGMGCGDRDEADPPVVNDLSPHAAVPKTVLATIPVGDGPWDMAIAPDGAHVYAANSNDGTISVINTSDYTVFTTAPIVEEVSKSPEKMGIAITPDGEYVYITDYKGDTLSLIDTETNAVVTDNVGDPLKISLGSGRNPVSLAISPDGNKIYVANYLRNTVSIIETTNHTVIDEISVGNKPYDLAITPDGQLVYVANSSANDATGQPDTVSVIKTMDNTVQTITVGNLPLDIAAGQFSAYVANNKDDTISAIDTDDYTVTAIAAKTDADTLGVGNTPMGVALMPDEDFLYVANEGGALGHTLTVIETASNTVEGEIALEDDTTYPRCIAIKPDGSAVYVTDYRNDSVIVIGF